jgi:hypothetical protein
MLMVRAKELEGEGRATAEEMHCCIQEEPEPRPKPLEGTAMPRVEAERLNGKPRPSVPAKRAGARAALVLELAAGQLGGGTLSGSLSSLPLALPGPEATAELQSEALEVRPLLVKPATLKVARAAPEPSRVNCQQ